MSNWLCDTFQSRNLFFLTNFEIVTYCFHTITTISTFCRGETSIAFTWAKILKQLTNNEVEWKEVKCEFAAGAGWSVSVFICFVFFSFISELNVEDCATNPQLCNRNAVCKTIEGSSICICNPGYSGNGKICTGNHNITNIPIRVVLNN